ncbi:MAG: hypothetical protein ACXU8A_12065 [Burkholderiaceae bacterium]
MKSRHILLGLGLVIAGWFAFFADKSPSGSIAAAVSRPAVSGATPSPNMSNAAVVRTSASGASASAGKVDQEPMLLSIEPRDTLIGGAHAGKQSETLFGFQTWTPPPPPPPKIVVPVIPTAPPLPFTFVGKKNEDGLWEVYLARGETTFIVRDKSMIESAYRVDAITPPTMSITYLPLNQIQTLIIGGID